LRTLSTFVFLSILCCMQSFAQATPDTRAVYVEAFSKNKAPSDADLKSAKLFLGKQEMTISAIENVSALPLHIVFVIDRAPHQGSLVQLALDYVGQLVKSLPNSEMTLTVLAAGKSPRLIAEADTAVDLVAALKEVDLTQHLDKDEAEGLYDGASKAVSLLNQSPGVRSIVIFSDDDDDISSKRLNDLKQQVAAAHIRCYSVLLAYRDFYSTKTRAASGSRLNALDGFSGGKEYGTKWQDRRSDPLVLHALASHIYEGSLITFSLPEHISVKPGIYNLRVKFGMNGKTAKTTPFRTPPLSSEAP
jgi:hypothetical protein